MLGQLVNKARDTVYKLVLSGFKIYWRQVPTMAQSPAPANPDRRQNYGIQFLTSPTADTPGTTVALVFDGKRYLFGHVAEGTQRALMQRGFGLRKVYDIFLTGPTNWSTNGGLMGLILTLADVLDGGEEGVRPRLHIHGPPKLLHTLATARRFIFRTGMPLTIQEVAAVVTSWPTEPSFVDQNIRVWSIPVKNAREVADEPQASRTTEEQLMRAKIVHDMFDSDWRRDRLVEKRFRDVRLPALVFVRGTEEKGLVGIHCATHDSAPQIERDQMVFVRNPWPASLIGDLPPADDLPSNVAVTYVIRGHIQRGSFDPAKAKALGLRPGPVYAKLTKGESVTLDNGEVITSDMVVGPARVAKGLAVFDLPSVGHAEYLESLLTTSPEDALADVDTATWILGAGVGVSECFRRLLQKLSSLKHFISDVDAAPNRVSMESTALSTRRLAKISPRNFSVPVYDNSRPYHGHEAIEQPVDYGTESQAVQAGLKVSLEPKHAIDESDLAPMGDLAAFDDLELPDSAIETQTPREASQMELETLSEPEIITLGTGSSSPSKYRNVSAILVRMPQNQGNMLLDCGESAIGQLRRTYTHLQVNEILRNTQAIWISHLHADHHLGTVSFLEARRKAFDALGEDGRHVDRTIFLLSEKNMMDFVREYSSVEPTIMTESGLVPVVCKPGIGPMLDNELFDIASTKSAIQRVDSVRVSHCAGSQAVSITFKSGFKISYSGDCRPSDQFCQIGIDSDVLIHEATFDDEMQGDALAKKHSTTSEALGVALRMRAKNVVLTHFSQRYPKIPNIGNIKVDDSIQYEEATAEQDSEPVEANGPPSQLPAATSSEGQEQGLQQAANGVKGAMNNVTPGQIMPDIPICIAFDLMRIKVSHIATAKKYFPAIQQMFELQEEATERKRQLARDELERQIEAKKARSGKKKKQHTPPRAKPAFTVVPVPNGELTSQGGNTAAAPTSAENGVVDGLQDSRHNDGLKRQKQPAALSKNAQKAQRRAAWEANKRAAPDSVPGVSEESTRAGGEAGPNPQKKHKAS